MFNGSDDDGDDDDEKIEAKIKLKLVSCACVCVHHGIWKIMFGAENAVIFFSLENS